jgi:hypothetical protein
MNRRGFLGWLVGGGAGIAVAEACHVVPATIEDLKAAERAPHLLCVDRRNVWVDWAGGSRVLSCPDEWRINVTFGAVGEPARQLIRDVVNSLGRRQEI